jgi:hemolysin activation/secretion protein
VLRIQVTEARLADVQVAGNRWYRSRYLRSRLIAAVSTPVQVGVLEEELQLLLQEQGIERVGGTLVPGLEQGDDVLQLALSESHPFQHGWRVANDNPPGIGAVKGRILFEDHSTFGFADQLTAFFDFAEGLAAQELRYELPFTGYQTALRLRIRSTGSKIIEDPARGHDIEAETWTASIGIWQPLIRTPRTQLALGASFDRRHSKTFLAGKGTKIIPGPDENGEADVSVLRLHADWTWRTTRDVVAARSVLSVGLNVLGATDHPGWEPDSNYVAWLGQAQWAHRFPASLLSAQLLTRVDVQLASRALLTMEQIAMGGVRTVRGYRENLFVSDSGVITSAELRIPILPGLLGRHRVDLAPFFDFGFAWDVGRPLEKRETLYSVGLGLRYAYSKYVDAYVYFGEPLTKANRVAGNIQDDGVHIGINLWFF